MLPFVFGNSFKRLIVVGAFLAVSACAPTMRQQQVPGSFAWFDLVTETPEAGERFYTQLFGWRFSDGQIENSRIISSGGELIGGLVPVAGTSKRAESQWEPILSVEDTLTSVQTAKSGGGRLAEQPVVTSAGTYAAILDPTSARVTLYDGDAGVPLGRPDQVNTWVWVDLLTHDTRRARNFYKSVAGFETVTSSNGTTVFTRDGKDRGGLVRVARSQIESNWLPYVLVSDLDVTIRSAESLGASVLIKERNAAILLDPTGAAIGIITREGVAR